MQNFKWIITPCVQTKVTKCSMWQCDIHTHVSKQVKHDVSLVWSGEKETACFQFSHASQELKAESLLSNMHHKECITAYMTSHTCTMLLQTLYIHHRSLVHNAQHDTGPSFSGLPSPIPPFFHPWCSGWRPVCPSQPFGSPAFFPRATPFGDGYHDGQRYARFGRLELSSRGVRWLSLKHR